MFFIEQESFCVYPPPTNTFTSDHPLACVTDVTIIVKSVTQATTPCAHENFFSRSSKLNEILESIPKCRRNRYCNNMFCQQHILLPVSLFLLIFLSLNFNTTLKIVVYKVASRAAILFIYVRSRSGRATIFHLLPSGIHCICLKPRDHKSANHVW